jgi:hypothetical protein
MVDWMQQVETQRAELRELNDLSFARIDARFGEARAELELLRPQIDARFGEFRHEMREELGELRRDMHTGFAHLETKLERRVADLMKWSFVFWVGSTVTLVVAMAALGRLGR